jgi:hypothetical protein
MAQRNTPLGFLAGSIALGSHCIYTYPEKDEAFALNLAQFLSAGLQVGEVCVCLADDDTCETLKDRLAGAGADKVAEDALIIRCAHEVYSPHGMWDADALCCFLGDTLADAARRGTQVRSFSDFGSVPWGRTARFKLLEFEAAMNLSCPMSIAMCGYHSASVSRNWLAQVRNAHPFIANDRSIRRNPSYAGPDRFLSGLHSYRRVSKEYPALPGADQALQADFEEVAARTPLSMSEIEALKMSLGELLAHLAVYGRPASETASPHIHIVFAPESDRFLITIRRHGFAGPADLRKHVESYRGMTDSVLDSLEVESWRGEPIVTMTKRYGSPLRVLGP